MPDSNHGIPKDSPLGGPRVWMIVLAVIVLLMICGGLGGCGLAFR